MFIKESKIKKTEATGTSKEPSESEPACISENSDSPAEMLRKAAEVACSRERIGISALQQALRIGYGRAADVLDTMESPGIIGPDPAIRPAAPFC